MSLITKIEAEFDALKAKHLFMSDRPLGVLDHLEQIGIGE